MSRTHVPTVAAEDVVVAVQTYADRLHDLLRRRELGVADATAIVTSSAEAMVDAAAGERAIDPLGWWWSRALSEADRSPTLKRPRVRDSDPVDAALLQLDEPLQLAVLLRDDYDLPLSSVAVALGVGRPVAADRILHGRLALVAAHDGTPLVDLSGHDSREAPDVPGLLGLADGLLTPAEAARTRRHLRGCAACEAVVTAAQRGRRLAAALPVEALADAPRDRLVASVEERAGALLPTLSELLMAQEEQREERAGPLVPLPVVLVALAVALVLGAITGAATAPSEKRATDAAPAPGATTAGAEATASATPTPSLTATATPTPRPRRTTPPPATATARPTRIGPVVAGPPEISIDPSSGPNNQAVNVTGQGWEPGLSVTIAYVNLLGQTTSSTSAVIDARGRFSAVLVCSDPVPGRHTIRASDGTNTASQSYQQQ